ncbi:hypothetical protein TUMEXPCC7403_19260 [Tumidithrix helvetica PCC 7403]
MMHGVVSPSREALLPLVVGNANVQRQVIEDGSVRIEAL